MKLDCWGTFWLESAPDRPVPGHLTFNDKKHGSLTLIGSLHPGRPSLMYRGSYERILGESLGRHLVLLDCFDGGGSSSGPNGAGTSTIVSHVLVNSILSSTTSLTGRADELFCGLTCEPAGLAEFMGPSGLDLEFGEPGRDDFEYQVVGRPLPDVDVATSFGTVTILHGIGHSSHDLQAEELTSQRFLRVTPATPTVREALLDFLGRVRELLALVMHQDCLFRGPLHLFPPLPEHADSHDDLPPDVKFYAVWARGRRHKWAMYNRVLSFDDIGATALANWLDMDADIGNVSSRLASLRFTRHIAYEDALVRVVSAADSFHRLLTGRDRERSRTVLKDLASYAGFPFTRVVTDLDRWAHTVINERDNAAHNKGRPLALPELVSELVDSVLLARVHLSASPRGGSRRGVHGGCEEPTLCLAHEANRGGVREWLSPPESSTPMPASACH